MSLTVIELNDSEIRTANGAEIVSRHPGYAVLKPDRIETGINAWNIARTNPRESSNRYWSQLNQDSLIIPSNLARHNADLAYAQLVAIHEHAGKPEEILFAVPGSYTREQLALLLGIVEACPFTAIGLVDSAIASTSAFANEGRYTHLDIHLHYVIATSIDVTDKVTRESVKVIDNVGISEIYDTCAEYFSDLFIDQSRFDPLHHAETEQNLYNQIPKCLVELKSSAESTLEIQFKDKRYQAKVSAESLLKKIKIHYEKIYQEITGHNNYLISDRLEILPGFSAPLTNKYAINETSVFRGCNINIDGIRSTESDVSFITSLPAAKSPVTSVNKTKQITNDIKTEKLVLPTHILVNNRAYFINRIPMYVSANGKVTHQKDGNTHCSIALGQDSVDIHSESDITVFTNGNKVNGGTSVTIGDTISLAGSDIIIKCIEVI